MNKTAHEPLLPLIERIQECALRPEQWPATIEGVLDYMGGVSAILWTHQATPDTWGVWVLCRIQEGSLDRYVAHFYKHDLWMIRAHEKGMFITGSLFIGAEIVDRRELLASVFYRDFLCGQDQHDVMGCVLHDGRSSALPQVHLAIFQSHAKPPFGPQDKERLRPLVPFLQRATEVNFTLAGLQRQVNLTSTAVEAVAPALLLLNQAGGVMYANQAARAVLDRQDGLCLRDGRLSASRVKEEAAVQGFLKAETTESGTLQIARSSGLPPLTLLRLPVADEEPGTPDARQARLAIVIQNPGAALSPDMEAFAQAYGLSPAEKRLATELVAGYLPKEAASRLGVSLSTVRTQMASVYAKTGVRREPELIRLVMSMPGIRRRG